VGGRGKIEAERVANIQWKNLVAVARELVGEDGHVPNGVAHVFEALGSGNGAGAGGGHRQLRALIVREAAIREANPLL